MEDRFKTLVLQHRGQAFLGEEVPVPGEVVVAPPTAGEEPVIEASQFRRFDDEDTTVLEEGMYPFADQGWVFDMLDQLEHDDRVEPFLLSLFFREVLDPLCMGFEAHCSALLDGCFVEFETDRIPVLVSGMSKEFEQAPVPATYIQDLALSLANELPIETDLAALPDPLEAGHEGASSRGEGVIVVRIDPIEFGDGRPRVQVLVAASAALNEREDLRCGVVLEVGSTCTDLTAVCTTKRTGASFQEQRSRATHARWVRGPCLA